MQEKSVLKIKKLRDCKFHFNEADSRRKPEEKEKCLNSMIFLTEGDSAAGSVSSSRDAETQAVFALRGVITNCYGLTKEVIYKNEELAIMVVKVLPDVTSVARISICSVRKISITTM